jgi:hypothetical protein
VGRRERSVSGHCNCHRYISYCPSRTCASGPTHLDRLFAYGETFTPAKEALASVDRSLTTREIALAIIVRSYRTSRMQCCRRPWPAG